MPSNAHCTLVVVGLGAELVELALVAGNPARGLHRDAFERTLHAVFILQSKGHHLELQLPHRAQDQVVVA
jgi:hypothetical protein